jgi:putative PIN family toxin of toxin-antitoxin system
MKVVVDSNVIYAGLFSKQGASHQILKLIRRKSIVPAISVALFGEYDDVLGREPLSKIFPDIDRNKFLNYLCSVGVLTEIYFLWRPFLKDPKDDMVLELSVAAQVRFIITHNLRYFRGIEAFGKEAITPRDFLNRKEI